MINVEKHGTVARLLILNYQMVMRMAHRYFLTTNVYYGFSILVCHGLQKSTMVYKRPPWSTKVYLGVQRSTMVYKSLPWSTEVHSNIGIKKRDRDNGGGGGGVRNPNARRSHHVKLWKSSSRNI